MVTSTTTATTDRELTVNDIRRRGVHDPMVWAATLGLWPLPPPGWHRQVYRWAAQLVDQTSTPEPLIVAAHRGGAKSTLLEIVVAWAVANGHRRYPLYVSGTQELGNQHVDAIAAVLTNPRVLEVHPWLHDLADQSVIHRDKQPGRVRARQWRQSRLAGPGWQIDSVGLDVSVRGRRDGEQRPDLIVLDDLDERDDSQTVVARKFQRVSSSILPAGELAGCGVVWVQNIPNPDGLLARRLAGDEPFRLLGDATVVGPIKAVDGLVTTVDDATGLRKVTGGVPTWPEGLGATEVESWISRVTWPVFLAEFQHEHPGKDGALLTPADLVHHDPYLWGDPERIVVAVDPAVKLRPGSDETGIVVVGLWLVDSRRRVAVLEDLSGRLPVSRWPGLVAETAARVGADMIVVEDNQGGDAWSVLLRKAAVESGVTLPRVRQVTAREAKAARAHPVAEAHSAGDVVFASRLDRLEGEWTRWVPGVGESPNRLDAEVWGVRELGVGVARRALSSPPVAERV